MICACFYYKVGQVKSVFDFPGICYSAEFERNPANQMNLISHLIILIIMWLDQILPLYYNHVSFLSITPDSGWSVFTRRGHKTTGLESSQAKQRRASGLHLWTAGFNFTALVLNILLIWKLYLCFFSVNLKK